jgi:hypothetical protein
MACTKCGEIHKDSLPPMYKVLLENETENNFVEYYGEKA